MVTYLKKATPPIEEKDTKTRSIVKEILSDIRSRGESAVCELAEKFDNWKRDFILGKEEIDSLIATVTQTAKDDIRFAYDQVYGFAVKQRESMQEFETELTPGVTLGQRLVPCQCAGCYVPGGAICACSLRSNECRYCQGGRCAVYRGLHPSQG